MKRNKEEINKIMMNVYPGFRYHWCEAESCFCMGCANRNPGLPITKEEWMEWVKENPDPKKRFPPATDKNPN